MEKEREEWGLGRERASRKRGGLGEREREGGERERESGERKREEVGGERGGEESERERERRSVNLSNT